MVSAFSGFSVITKRREAWSEPIIMSRIWTAVSPPLSFDVETADLEQFKELRMIVSDDAWG